MTAKHVLPLLIFAVACGDPSVIAITDVTVIDVSRGVAEPGRTVVVAGENIEAVGAAADVKVPRGATEVDGRGRFLIPGLWDMHVHTSSDAITRETLLPLFLANGVTGVRIMAADCFEDADPGCVEEGLPEALPTISGVRAWQDEVMTGQLPGPRMIAGSYYVNSPGASQPSTAYFPRTEEHGREHARVLKARGVDFIKVSSGLSRAAFFGLAEEANRLDLPFAGHTPFEVWASEVSDAGQRSIEHLGFGNVEMECSTDAERLRERLLAEFESPAPELLPILLEQVATYDLPTCRALAERFVRNGTWVVPTLMLARLSDEVGEGWRSDPYSRFLPEAERVLWDSREPLFERDLGDLESRAPHSRWMRDLTKMMHEAGVQIMAGSDAGEVGVYWGTALHQELELMVSAGLSEVEVLRAATLSPADFLGLTSELGSIDAGKGADLVLLDGNPLERISNTRRIVSVVARGRLYDRAALDALLTQAEPRQWGYEER